MAWLWTGCMLSTCGDTLGEDSTVLAWLRIDRMSPRIVMSIACKCSAAVSGDTGFDECFRIRISQRDGDLSFCEECFPLRFSS